MQRESVEASVFSLKKEKIYFSRCFSRMEIFNLEISIWYNVIRVIFKSIIWLQACWIDVIGSFEFDKCLNIDILLKGRIPQL